MRAMSKILIKEEVYDKVMHWVQSSAPNEVSGFGKVTINDKGEFEINEAYLIEQEVGGAHTDIDAKGLAKLMYESKDEPGQLRWWLPRRRWCAGRFPFCAQHWKHYGYFPCNRQEVLTMGYTEKNEYPRSWRNVPPVHKVGGKPDYTRSQQEREEIAAQWNANWEQQQTEVGE